MSVLIVRLVLEIVDYSWTAYCLLLLGLDLFPEEFMNEPFFLNLGYELRLIWLVMMQLTKFLC